MGVKDITANAFLADNKRFADVCNYYLYNGEDVIRPEELLEQDGPRSLHEMLWDETDG